MIWRKSLHITRHSLKWLRWTLVLPALLLMLLLAMLLYTSAGLRFNLWLAEKAVPGLSINSSQGSLLGGHILYGVRYQQPGIDIALQESEFDFRSRCLLTLTLCVDTLRVSGIEVTLDQNSQDSQTQSGTSLPFWLPMPLVITQLQLSDVSIHTDAAKVQWQQFSSPILAWGNKVQLSQPEWQTLRVILAETADTSSMASATPQKLQYQVPQLPAFALPLRLFVDRFRLTDARVQQSGVEHTLDALTLSLHWQHNDLQLLNLDAHNAQGQLHASAAVTTKNNYPLTLKASLDFQQPPLQGQALHINSEGDLTDLRLTANASGVVDATLSLWLNLLDANLPHALHISSPQFTWPPQHDTATLRLEQTELNLEGNLQQSRLSARTTASGVSLPGSSRLELAGRANLDGVQLQQLQLDTLGGQLNASAGLDWQDGLKLTGNTHLSNIQPGMLAPQYAGVLNGSLQFQASIDPMQRWQLHVSELALAGTLRDYALNLKGEIDATDRSGQGDYHFSSKGLILQHADNRVALKGSLAQDWLVELEVDIPALAQSLPAASGNIRGQFSLNGKRSTPKLVGQLSARNVKWQDIELPQSEISSQFWLDDTQQLHSQLELTAKQAKIQQQILDLLQLSLTGSEQQHQLELSVQSQQHQAEIALSGSLSNHRQRWQAQLQQARIASVLGQWQLEQSTAIEVDLPNKHVEMDAHCWLQQETQLCLSAPLSASAQQITAKLSLQQFNLASLTPLMPAQSDLSGKINSTLELDWQQGKHPTAILDVTGSEGSFTQQLDSPLQLAWQTLKLQSKLEGDTVDNQLQLQFTTQSALNADIHLAKLSRDDRTLAGTFSLQQFDLAFLAPLLGELTEFQGEANSTLELSGELQNPQLNGALKLSRLKLKGKQAPTDIDDANLDITLNGKHASIQGQISTPDGNIDIDGQAQWPQLDNWQAALHIKGDELKLQVPNARIMLAPDLTLNATPELTKLSGTIKIPQANISIKNLPQSAVELSDDTVMVDSNRHPLPQQEKSSVLFETDINLQLGDNVKLSAFGLKTHLHGKLRVRQQPHQVVRINGDVNLKDGTFRAYGQDLLIRKGKMNFNGPADQPFLDIEAIRNPDNMEDDVIAGIRVNGPADEPSVRIFSEPAKAQANALSYLISGRDLESGSGSSGSAITTSLIGMTLASSSKVVGEIGEAFGLKDLTLDTAGAGDNSQVTVSGYLSPDLQLKYGYGIFNAVGEFTLRYRLMKRLYLEAIAGLDNAVDLLYKFEFD